MKFLTFLEKLNKKFLNKPLINILTRSSNRPVGFARNRNSVKAQLYPRINHSEASLQENNLQLLPQLLKSNYR